MATRAALAFIDTETTALSHFDGRIWEIGLILRGPGQEEEQHITLQVDGITAGEFEPKAMEVSGWNERYGLDARVLEQGTMVHALTGWLAGRHLVGANPAFDQGFLQKMFRQYLIAPTWHHRLIDVEALAMQELGCPTPMGLRQSADALGVPYKEEDLHTAYGDALLAMRIYDLVVHGTVPPGRLQ